MKLLLLCAVAAIMVLTASSGPTKSFRGSRMVCYFGSWAVYRHGNAKITADDIDTNICTHFIYSFAGLDDSSNKIKFMDPWLEIGDPWKTGMITELQKKARSTNTKFMLAMGGWNEGSTKYSKTICNSSRRKILVSSIVQIISEHGFDGFDIDWEYPGARGGSPDDKYCLIKFIEELRHDFDPKGWELSAAVSANANDLIQLYDVPAMNKLSFINVMAYDLHGSWEKTTGHNAPLYGRADEPASESHLNVAAAIRAWIKLGAKPENLNLGVGTYGRSFLLADPAKHDLGSPATGFPPAGGWVEEPGFYGYNDICANNRTVWTTGWNSEQAVPYAWSGNKFVGYDDIDSTRLKTCFAKSLGLGGMMVWSVETDDFSGRCGQGKYPIINAAISTLQDNSCPSDGTITDAPEVKPTTTEAPATEEPTSPESPATEEPTSPEAPATEETTSPESPATEEPTSPEAPATEETTATTETIAPEPEIPADTLQPDQSATTEGPETVACQNAGDVIGSRTDCSSFYFCHLGADRSLQATPMKCAAGLNFDSSIQTCNYAAVTPCEL